MAVEVGIEVMWELNMYQFLVGMGLRRRAIKLIPCWLKWGKQRTDMEIYIT